MVISVPQLAHVALEMFADSCLEAQMVETGLTNAAKVARVIPRCNAWAVTGYCYTLDS